MLAKIRSASRSFFFPTWSIPLALLVVTILSYGLRALSLGFFWDDWPYLWFFHRFGEEGIVSAFSGDRPFLSFIYNISLTVLGNSIQGWQIFGLLARWLCGLGFWWALSQAWPRSANKAAWAAMLFTVYPGFTQQWISVIYGQAFLLFSLIFFSTGLTLWLIRRRAVLHRGVIAVGTLLALALSAFTMFSTEYFFGIELLRPILIWIVLYQQDQAGTVKSHHTQNPIGRKAGWVQRALRTSAWWAPYLALMIAFVLWRAVIHPFAGYKMTTLQGVENAPLDTLSNLALNIVEDSIVSSFGAWGQPLQIFPGFLEADPGQGLRLLFVIVLTGALTGIYLRFLRSRHDEQPESTQQANLSWGIQAVLVGVLIVLASGWPTWITNLPMRMGFPLDRYSLAMSTGVSLALAGLIDLVGRDLLRKTAVLALALSLAAGFHFHTALSYDQDWSDMRSLFWQLSWRAPQIKPGTLFGTMNMPLKYYEDDSLTAPLNWMYDPEGQEKEISFLLFDLQVRSRSLQYLRTNEPVNHDFRAANFSGSTSQMLLFTYNPPGCLHILDPRYDSEIYQLPARMLRGIEVSDPQAVISDSSSPAEPPVEIFGNEPKHRWCYYYEKAELARQNSDWETIRKISRQSIHEGFRPEDPVEYLPFIEGHARLGKGGDALQLSYDAERQTPALRPAICAVWARAYESTPNLDPVYRKKLVKDFHCSIP